MDSSGLQIVNFNEQWESGIVVGYKLGYSMDRSGITDKKLVRDTENMGVKDCSVILSIRLEFQQTALRCIYSNLYVLTNE